MREAELSPILHTGAAANSSMMQRRKNPNGSRQKPGLEIDSSGQGLDHADRVLFDLSPATNSGRTRRTTRRSKTRSSLLHRCRRFALKHTWTFPLALLLVFLSLYAIDPTESNIVHHFIFLSYEIQGDGPGSRQYGKGPWDVAFVAFYTIVLAFTRDFISQEILRPLALHYGLRSRGKQARFIEQTYTVLYCLLLGPAGLYVMSRTPVWYFDTRGMYEAFPHKTHEVCFKFYYLFQAAYWLHQALVMLLGLEKRRKDFKELVAHHIVTVALIALSYRFHFTYMGIAVYVTHDISDMFLAGSKALNYIDSPMVGPFYGVFVCAWIYLRHYLNLRIIASLFTEFRTVGPYKLDWEAEQYKCLLSNVVTFVLLAALQALNLFWLYCVLRNGYKFVVYNSRKDDRSEESEGEEVEPNDGDVKKSRQRKSRMVNSTPSLKGRAVQ